MEITTRIDADPDRMPRTNVGWSFKFSEYSHLFNLNTEFSQHMPFQVNSSKFKVVSAKLPNA